MTRLAGPKTLQPLRPPVFFRRLRYVSRLPRIGAAVLFRFFLTVKGAGNTLLGLTRRTLHNRFFWGGECSRSFATKVHHGELEVHKIRRMRAKISYRKYRTKFISLS